MKVRDIYVRKIFDSRGEPTIEIDLEDHSGLVFSAQVPSGKSRGIREACVFDYPKAKKVVDGFLSHKLRGRSFATIRALDTFLLRLDATPEKKKLGGNVMLGLSVACARSLAHARKEKIWRLLRREFFKGAKDRLPFIFSNLINGGMHAENNLDIQEYMVVVKSRRPIEKSIETLVRFYRELGASLKKKSKLPTLPIGDEGGYSLFFKDNFKPILILEALIKKMKLKREFAIALDAAASSFYKNGAYAFGNKRFLAHDLHKIYLSYMKRVPLLISIEDPFSETDYFGFARLTGETRGKLIVGDDLTVTNPTLIREYAGERLVNAVIIKPNQIGTVSEACNAIHEAHRHGLKCIVSHRSGETEDNFIIHLARAGGVYGVKIGAPTRERVTKFNELARIYSE